MSDLPPFEGCAMELTRLLAPVVLPRPDTPAVVLVTGPGGAGRSRLLAEAARRGRARDPAVRVWAANLGVPGELEALLARLELGPGSRTERMVAAGTALLRAAEAGPLALALDDLQRAGSEALDLVAALARTLRGHRWRRGLPPVALWLAARDPAPSPLRAELEQGVGVARLALEARGAAAPAVDPDPPEPSPFAPIEGADPVLAGADADAAAARVHVDRLEYRAALARLDRALPVYERLSREPKALQVLADSGQLRLRLGDLAGAERDLRGALGLARAQGPRRAERFCLDGLAQVAAERDEPGPAQAALAEGDGLDRDAISRLERAEVLARLGWCGPVRPELLDLLAEVRDGAVDLVPRVLVVAARATLGDGDAEAALELAAEANALSAPGAIRCEALAAQSRCYVTLGRLDDALRLAEQARAHEVGDDALARFAATEAWGAALLAAGRPEDAARAVCASVAVGRGLGLRRRADRMAVVLGAGLRAADAGDARAALELLEPPTT